MRVSDISNWAACEVMALQSPPRPAGRANVAAWVGTVAHNLLSDGPAIEWPDRLAFDAITPGPMHAGTQAAAISLKARELLVEQGWGVLETEQEVRRDELVGHLDIRAWHSRYGEAIIDLKTGQGVGMAWLQVGGYIDLDDLYSDGARADWGGVLHVPRVPIHKDVKGTLSLRPAQPLWDAWSQRYDRIKNVLTGRPPMPTPGIHCGRCGIQDCPVRI